VTATERLAHVVRGAVAAYRAIHEFRTAVSYLVCLGFLISVVFLTSYNHTFLSLLERNGFQQTAYATLIILVAE
jgi:hypothetical protein